MARYVVGDIQGCYSALKRLLEKARFDPNQDRIFCIGDIVNRGGESVQVLQYLHSIRSCVDMVLGNHDLYLLALLAGNREKKASPELAQVMSHPDAEQWFNWLRHKHLILEDTSAQQLLVHAGIPHIWNIAQAISLAQEVEDVLRSDQAIGFLQQLYGNHPDKWRDDLQGVARWRCIVNYLTRMRCITADGRLDLETSVGLDLDRDTTVDMYKPWFAHKRKDQPPRIIFGHWAALQGDTKTSAHIPVLATDTGYVWGGYLTLFDLDDSQRIFRVSAPS